MIIPPLPDSIAEGLHWKVGKCLSNCIDRMETISMSQLVKREGSRLLGVGEEDGQIGRTTGMSRPRSS
jgi:hypothetical protein